MAEEKEEKEDKKSKNKIPIDFKNKPNKSKFNFYWIYGIIVALILGMQFFNFKNDEVILKNWGEVKLLLDNNEVDRIIIINKKFAEIYLKDAYKSKYKDKFKGFSEGSKYFFIYKTVDGLENKIRTEYPSLELTTDERNEWTKEIIGWLLPIIIIVVFWIFLMRRMGGGAGGGQIFNIGKSKAQIFDKDTSVKIDFNDVAGLEEAKLEVKEIVDFLKNPNKYTDLGGKIPKGALLVGPPGTGKTLLAKAMAGEAKVPFFSLSGSDFVEMFVGVGASRVRDLFKQAKEKAPCIIFIDEIDAIGRARGRNAVTGANDERENTLNQLLSEMDGFATNAGVIILAATNRADILDRALLRAGRFDRQIHVELPDLKERKEIFKVHMKPLKIDTTLDIDFLAKQTPGFSGADIANVCNESALIAARSDKKLIGKEDMIAAIDRIIGGLEKRNKIISKKEKRVIAFHETGHASVSWLLQYAHPLVKVTIIPRGKALGAAWYLPEERQITTAEQMMDEITSLLGGRAAEEVFFGNVSTGALNDLEKTTKQVYAMVVFYGLNKKVGNISYYDSTGQNEYNLTKPYSEKTAQVIDEEISSIIESAYQRAKTIISENKEKIEKLAEKLLEKEVIYREDLEEIFGKRLYETEEEELKEELSAMPVEEKKEDQNNIKQDEQTSEDQI